MVFDIVSFIAGVAAGGITGALAGVLHGLESTADLQERLRVLTKEVQSMRTTFSGPSGTNDPGVKVRMDELYRDLTEIHEEIRRMYKKATR